MSIFELYDCLVSWVLLSILAWGVGGASPLNSYFMFIMSYLTLAWVVFLYSVFWNVGRASPSNSYSCLGSIPVFRILFSV